MPDEPDLRQYASELQTMLRQRSPDAYRAFLRTWRDLHQRGAADKLLAMDDAALRLRIERMILDMPALDDLHPSARTFLAEHGGASPAAGTDAAPTARPGLPAGSAPVPQRPGRTSGVVRLRRRPQQNP